jgi:Tannase-like family of unknown function (DUF6351)
VIRNRPTDLSDACWTSPTTRIDEPFGLAVAGVCESLYPTWGDTRLAAGQGLADDVLKCKLQPLRARDYDVALTDGQLARLHAVFPDGVCHYGKKGVEQRPAKGPWLHWDG